MQHNTACCVLHCLSSDPQLIVTQEFCGIMAVLHCQEDLVTMRVSAEGIMLRE